MKKYFLILIGYSLLYSESAKSFFLDAEGDFLPKTLNLNSYSTIWGLSKDTSCPSPKL